MGGVVRSFRPALEAGHKAERAWVESLRRLGRAVGHGVKEVRASVNKRTDHCPNPDALALFSVEIKERNLEFDDPDSFPYDTVFVDDLRGLSKEQNRNLIYVYISKITGQWVWLTLLDKDDTWQETTTYDRGRGHEVPVLVAPKSCLRPAQELIELIYPQGMLDLVDGDTGAFGGTAGGDQTPEGGDRTPQKKADRNVGDR